MVLMIKKGGLAGWIRAYTFRGCATRRRRSWRHQGSIEVGGSWGFAVRLRARPPVRFPADFQSPLYVDKNENVFSPEKLILLFIIALRKLLRRQNIF